jgi:hypothetical protein
MGKLTVTLWSVLFTGLAWAKPSLPTDNKPPTPEALQGPSPVDDARC